MIDSIKKEILDIIEDDVKEKVVSTLLKLIDEYYNQKIKDATQITELVRKETQKKHRVCTECGTRLPEKAILLDELCKPCYEAIKRKEQDSIDFMVECYKNMNSEANRLKEVYKTKEKT